MPAQPIKYIKKHIFSLRPCMKQDVQPILKKLYMMHNLTYKNIVR